MVDFLIAKIIKTHWAGRWSQINRKGTFLVASPNQRSKYVKPQFEVKFWRPLWFDNHDKPFWKWHTKCNWMVMQKLGVTSKNHLFFPIFNWFWKFSISLEVGQTSLNQKISQKSLLYWPEVLDSRWTGPKFSPSPYLEGTGWDRELEFCVYLCPLLSPHPPPVLSVYLLILLLISSSLFSLEEGSSRTCVGVVPRDLPLCDIMSGIRWLLFHSNTLCCTILSVERCSLGNTSLHRDNMTPLLQEYSRAGSLCLAFVQAGGWYFGAG